MELEEILDKLNELDKKYQKKSDKAYDQWINSLAESDNEDYVAAEAKTSVIYEIKEWLEKASKK